MRSRSEIRASIEIELYELLKHYPHDGFMGSEMHWNITGQLQHMATYGDEGFCFDMDICLGVREFATHPQASILFRLKALEDELHEWNETHVSWGQLDSSSHHPKEVSNG